MAGNSVLFFTYWYPNKNSKSFGIFIKRHAQAAGVNNKVKVLAINIIKGNSVYKKYTHILTDESGIETHHIYFESIFNKLFYILLPLHYLVARNYIDEKIIKAHPFTILHSSIVF